MVTSRLSYITYIYPGRDLLMQHIASLELYSEMLYIYILGSQVIIRYSLLTQEISLTWLVII